ncbi:MAG: metal ABC transporter permease [Propionibacteriaceae bacterium]|jgi:zinc transport system permease protein|nr:metal ABC transporter permease [Propionibacteriaceae bacterium]
MIFTLEFMQRALIAAAIAGVVSPTVGAFIVQRRLSLLGDGLGHVAIAGVGLALATGMAPLPVAVVVAILGAVIIELLRSSGRASADTAMAVIFYGGLATGILLAGMVGQGAGTLSSYLFGSLLSVEALDIWLIGILGAAIVVLVFGLFKQLFAVSSDEDYAHTLGLNVRFYNLLIVVLAACTITVSMRTVGLLMVSALMVVPVAASNNLTRGFSRSVLVAMGLGLFSALAGVIGSFYLDAPPGSLIVVITIICFVISLPLGKQLLRRRRGLQVVEAVEPPPPHIPADEDCEHVHGPGCGHRAVIHGSHVDYLVDGHRHAEHEGHYDEH